uniref:Uncharacterized protein n=1 Tax=Anguilla anguilla TaxID=7936 RepID=A0A0E9PLR8_ANGAN
MEVYEILTIPYNS